VVDFSLTRSNLDAAWGGDRGVVHIAFFYPLYAITLPPRPMSYFFGHATDVLVHCEIKSWETLLNTSEVCKRNDKNMSYSFIFFVLLQSLQILFAEGDLHVPGIVCIRGTRVPTYASPALT